MTEAPFGLEMRDWLFDGHPIRSDWHKQAWARLDWSRAHVDAGPSPMGNPGPYWHVPYEAHGDEIYARLYPKVVTSKWQPMIEAAMRNFAPPPPNTGADK